MCISGASPSAGHGGLAVDVYTVFSPDGRYKKLHTKVFSKIHVE